MARADNVLRLLKAPHPAQISGRLKEQLKVRPEEQKKCWIRLNSSTKSRNQRPQCSALATMYTISIKQPGKPVILRRNLKTIGTTFGWRYTSQWRREWPCLKVSQNLTYVFWPPRGKAVYYKILSDPQREDHTAPQVLQTFVSELEICIWWVLMVCIVDVSKLYSSVKHSKTNVQPPWGMLKGFRISFDVNIKPW